MGLYDTGEDYYEDSHERKVIRSKTMTEELKPIDITKYTITENGNVIRSKTTNEELKQRAEENYTIEQNCGENIVEGGVLSVSGSVSEKHTCIEKLNMIAEWQEQYKQLIEDLDNSKKQITDLEWQLQQVIEDNDYYQKENEELQEEINEWKTKFENLQKYLDTQNCYRECAETWQKNKELQEQIEKMKKYIKACWIEENLNDYSSYITNSSDEFRDLVKELNEEIRNGR